MSEDFYEILQVHPRADQEAIAAAYTRLRERYDPARLENLAEELRELARQKRDAVERAYAVLSDQVRRATYDASYAQKQKVEESSNGSSQPAEPLLDYRPLPPAKRNERPHGFDAQPILSGDPTAPAATKPRALKELLTGIAGLLVLSAVLSILVINSGLFAPTPPPAAEAPVETPQPSQPSAFDQFEDSIAEARLITEQEPNNPQSWADYGHMLYNSVEIVRENDPDGALYKQRLPRWLQASEAYSRALALAPDNPELRADLGVSTCFYGAGTGEQQYVLQGTSEVQRAVQQAPDHPRVLLSLGYCLISKQPPQTAEAIATWRHLTEVAPESPLAIQARQLIEQFAR